MEKSIAQDHCVNVVSTHRDRCQTADAVCMQKACNPRHEGIQNECEVRSKQNSSSKRRKKSRHNNRLLQSFLSRIARTKSYFKACNQHKASCRAVETSTTDGNTTKTYSRNSIDRPIEDSDDEIEGRSIHRKHIRTIHATGSRYHKNPSKDLHSTSKDSLAHLHQLVESFEKMMANDITIAEAHPQEPILDEDADRIEGSAGSKILEDDEEMEIAKIRDSGQRTARMDNEHNGVGCVSSMLRRQSSRLIVTDFDTVHEGLTTSAASFTALQHNLQEYSRCPTAMPHRHSTGSLSMSGSKLRGTPKSSTLRLRKKASIQQADSGSSDLLDKMHKALKSGVRQTWEGELTRIDFGSNFSNTSSTKVPLSATKSDNLLDNAIRRMPFRSTKSDVSLNDAIPSAYRSGGVHRVYSSITTEERIRAPHAGLTSSSRITSNDNDPEIISESAAETDRQSEMCESYDTSEYDSGVASSISSIDGPALPDVDFAKLIRQYKKTFQTIDWGVGLGNNGALNIAMLGARNTGKSTLLHRLQHGLFNAVYEPSVSDLTAHNLTVAGNNCHVRILDSSVDAWTGAKDVLFGSGIPIRGILREPRFGRSRSHSAADLTTKEKNLALHRTKSSRAKSDIPQILDPLWWAHGYILTFSVGDERSFKHVIALKEELVDRRRRFMQNSYVPVPITVVGTKVDLYTAATQGMYNGTKNLPSWVAEAYRLVTNEWNMEFRLVTCTQGQCTDVFFTLGRKMRDYYLRMLLRDKHGYSPNYRENTDTPLMGGSRSSSVMNSPTSASIDTI